MTPPARSILIVDDDEEVRDALHDALCFEGFTVKIAQNGQEALEALRADERSAWIVLLDIMMPVMDGRAFLKHREGDAALARIPVIVLSAGGDCREIERTQAISCCLPKTVRIPELMRAIATHS
jgi:two-component system response regulator MprA